MVGAGVVVVRKKARRGGERRSRTARCEGSCAARWSSLRDAAIAAASRTSSLGRRSTARRSIRARADAECASVPSCTGHAGDAEAARGEEGAASESPAKRKPAPGAARPPPHPPRGAPVRPRKPARHSRPHVQPSKLRRCVALEPRSAASFLRYSVAVARPSVGEEGGVRRSRCSDGHPTTFGAADGVEAPFLAASTSVCAPLRCKLALPKLQRHMSCLTALDYETMSRELTAHLQSSKGGCRSAYLRYERHGFAVRKAERRAAQQQRSDAAFGADSDCAMA
jgi:hypothetical protein